MTTITRRAALALGGAAFATRAHAQDSWPNRPLRIIVPFPPGGPADGSARALAEVMSPALGQPVVVENRAGAGGVIGITAAAQATDGHTLLMGSTSMTVTPALRADLPYDIFRDFAPVGMVSAQPLVLVVPANSPLRDVAAVVAAGKNPGLNSGTSGNGTLSHLAIELFNARTGTQISPVAYRGESAIVPDLLNATLSMGFLNLPILLPLLAEGKLRALAVGSPQRSDRLPTVPTFAEAGVQGMEAQGWAALLAAKGVPEAGLAKLEAALQTALRSEPVKARFAAFGVTPVISTRAGLAQYLREEYERWGEVVRSRGIRAQ
ncbi:tripartite tricarboxylate transporter substrate binding protein [Roseomonas sp. AR75]|uniref:Bug family tripartite tricarboxylate transporter substrate binding protein n=1 Tax=Roseomonas sp. AR75 TaxID=2562311 RepID=UPI0010C00AEA|nr:tripartite tricarboxylate transporter substrate binding protein [Roseomonas sp. AR75]